MAKEQNKNDQTNSVENRLRSLYELQTINSKIDEIRKVRGELPEEVNDLDATIEGLQRRIQKNKEAIEQLRVNTTKENNAILDAQAKIATYQQQIDNVRNNREYDMLSKEIEFQNLEIKLSEKRINQYARDIETKTAEIDATTMTLSDQRHMLEEKRRQLDEIVSETRKDEEDLRVQAKEIEEKIDDARLLKAFKRIRKNARNGLGIVYIQRDACGGCFNRIPPQRQAEIRMHKKIIVCEYCGRIMIDPALAGVETPEGK